MHDSCCALAVAGLGVGCGAGTSTVLTARACPVPPTLQNNPEPNGRRVPELCLAANWTQRYNQEGGSGDAWGYMDAGCSSKFIFMCKIMRG
jgi:hypothetical protein